MPLVALYDCPADYGLPHAQMTAPMTGVGSIFDSIVAFAENPSGDRLQAAQLQLAKENQNLTDNYESRVVVARPSTSSFDAVSNFFSGDQSNANFFANGPSPAKASVGPEYQGFAIRPYPVLPVKNNMPDTLSDLLSQAGAAIVAPFVSPQATITPNAPSSFQFSSNLRTGVQATAAGVYSAASKKTGPTNQVSAVPGAGGFVNSVSQMMKAIMDPITSSRIAVQDAKNAGRLPPSTDTNWGQLGLIAGGVALVGLLVYAVARASRKGTP